MFERLYHFIIYWLYFAVPIFWVCGTAVLHIIMYWFYFASRQLWAAGLPWVHQGTELAHSLPLPYNYRAQLPPDSTELNFLSPTEHSPRVPLTHSCICTLSFFNSSLRHSLFDITGLYLAYSLHSFIHYHIGFIKPRSSMDVPTQFPFNLHQPSFLIPRFDFFKFYSLFCGCLLIYTFTHSHLS